MESGGAGAKGHLEDSGESGPNSGLLGERFAPDNGGIAADRIERVLVKDGCHGFI